MLIALSLTAILLTFLFSFFVESVRIEKKLDTARMAITARSHLQTRLQTVLGSLERNSFDAPLYIQQFDKEKQPSLVAIFNNGIDPDPAFSGPVLARLFIDEENNLTLATWPLEKEKTHPWRKEVLLSHVESFEFEFLGHASAAEKKEKLRPINAAYAWRTRWSQKETPSLIRLTLTEQKQDPIHFAFILPSPEPLVIYQKRKT